MDFNDKVAIVTGGGTGVGRATSLKLARAGAKVVVNYSRSRDDAEETVAEIAKAGGDAVAFRADVSLDGEARSLAAEAVKRYGTVHILVNNAGITRKIDMKDLEAATDEVWDLLMAVNVKGMFHCARAAAPEMRRNRCGSILNIGSSSGVNGIGSSLPYAVSKAAVHGLTRSLAHALAPEIRVNCVAPGPILTRWWKGDEERMHKTAGNLLLQRVSSPEDIADLALAVLAQDSMTGQVVGANNGLTM